MGTANKNGFTIIETVLFLAVTGLMIMGVLVSTGTSINTQRYRDSVSTLKSYLQQQYTETSNVRNQNSGTSLACDSNASVIVSGPGAKPRGQGECVILGRYVVIENSQVESSTVVGYGTPNPSLNDVANLKTYKMSLLPGSTETRELEWGTKIAYPKTGLDSRSGSTSRTLALLVLKSPLSGNSYTFTADSRFSNFADIVVAGSGVPGQATRVVCVDSAGLFAGGLSVYIEAMSSGVGAIQTRSNDTETAFQC